MYGTKGALLYSGNDREESSGKLELCRSSGAIEVVHDGFVFEELDQEGLGPSSMQSFLAACLGKPESGGVDQQDGGYYVGADSLVGLRTVQTIDAMYRSNRTGMTEDVLYT